jgi:hypothetical protein
MAGQAGEHGSEELRWHAIDLEHCTASWRRVFFNIWDGDCTLVAADGIDRAFGELAQQYPDGVAILGVSRPGVAMVPAPAVRERLVKMFRTHSAGLRCIASAILGDGFTAATKRTVMATIGMIARQPAPLRIFDNRGAAAMWLCDQLARSGDAPSATEVLEMLAGLEIAFDKRLPERRAATAV